MRRVLQRLWAGGNWIQLPAAAGASVFDIVPAGKPVAPVVAGPAPPFALSGVRLLASPLYDAMLRDQKHLLSLDPGRLLRNFRAHVGLPAASATLPANLN